MIAVSKRERSGYSTEPSPSPLKQGKDGRGTGKPLGQGSAIITAQFPLVSRDGRNGEAQRGGGGKGGGGFSVAEIMVAAKSTGETRDPLQVRKPHSSFSTGQKESPTTRQTTEFRHLDHNNTDHLLHSTQPLSSVGKNLKKGLVQPDFITPQSRAVTSPANLSSALLSLQTPQQPQSASTSTVQSTASSLTPATPVLSTVAANSVPSLPDEPVQKQVQVQVYCVLCSIV